MGVLISVAGFSLTLLGAVFGLRYLYFESGSILSVSALVVLVGLTLLFARKSLLELSELPFTNWFALKFKSEGMNFVPETILRRFIALILLTFSIPFFVATFTLAFVSLKNLYRMMF